MAGGVIPETFAVRFWRKDGWTKIVPMALPFPAQVSLADLGRPVSVGISEVDSDLGAHVRTYVLQCRYAHTTGIQEYSYHEV